MQNKSFKYCKVSNRDGSSLLLHIFGIFISVLTSNILKKGNETTLYHHTNVGLKFTLLNIVNRYMYYVFLMVPLSCDSKTRHIYLMYMTTSFLIIILLIKWTKCIKFIQKKID